VDAEGPDTTDDSPPTLPGGEPVAATLVTSGRREPAPGPGYPDEVQMDSGSVLGERYALQRRLAVGGMGEVWCAHDTLLGRSVAVKLPKPELRAEPGFADRLLAEARHAAAVDHPGIAAVYDVSAAQPVPYLVLEHVDGRPLSRLVAEEAPLPPQRARSLICQVAVALDAAHTAGLIHRDIKPANLLVTPDDTVKVTDFGIARAVGADTTTRTGFVVGTAQYLSPEQAGGAPASAASDLYALGVVAYELLTGSRPFDGDPLSVLRSHREDPVPALPPAVPADLRALVSGLLAKDPAERPTAAQVSGRDPVAGAGPATRTLTLPAARLSAEGPVTAPPAVPPVQPEDAEAPAEPDGSPALAAAPVLAPVIGGADRAADAAVSASARRPRAALAGAAVVLAGLLGVTSVTAGERSSLPQAFDELPGAPAAGAQEGGAAPSDPVPVADVSLFHPGGSGRDRPREVGLAVDGNPETAWTTQRYNSPEFGNLRPGVGLLYDLGEPREVRQVLLRVASPGLSLRLHAGDEPGDPLLDTPPLGAAPDAPESTVLDLAEPVTARYWVVWVDRLPPSGRHQAALADTVFLG
jgi:eukaryotic-like serine/threonine-protein kinase